MTDLEKQMAEALLLAYEALSGSTDKTLLPRAHRAVEQALAQFDAQAAEQAAGGGEAVAVIGRDWQFLWASGDAIVDIVKRHGLKIGTKLYTHPAPAAPVQPAHWEAVTAANQQAEPSSGSNAEAPVVAGPSDARVEAAAKAIADVSEAGWLTLEERHQDEYRSEARAALKAADAVSAGAGWMPIETAPKDGTMLLLAGFNFGNPQRGQHITAGSWRNERGWWEGLPDPVAEHLTANTQLNNLTHWMPLPAAPGSEQKEGANG